MLSVARRLKRGSGVAVLVLMGALPLFAQDQLSTSTDNSLLWTMLLIVFIGALIAWYAFSRNKLRKEQQSDLLERQGQTPVAAPESMPMPAPVKTPPTTPVITPANVTPRARESAQAVKSDEPAKSIFISYRRQDSVHITGRIYDRLSAQFGKDAVFKDVDSMPLGLDFRDHIREQVSRCAVLVAVIGKNWKGTTAAGDSRLNDERDHLRIEIEAALERHIPVIPVLVDGVEMPTEDDLPPALTSLAYRHGIAVRPDPDFHNDADRLARGIESLLK